MTSEIVTQTDSYFNISEIPPGVPRPKLPWGYSYLQFHCLLREYPDIHPKDFVTYRILQSYPRHGTKEDWGQVAAVLSHMMGGRLTFIAELMVILNRAARLDRNHPMSIVKEQNVLDLVALERSRSTVPRGVGVLLALGAPPGGPPMAAPQPQAGPSGAQIIFPCLLSLKLGPQGPKVVVLYLLSLQLGPQGPKLAVILSPQGLRMLSSSVRTRTHLRRHLPSLATWRRKRRMMRAREMTRWIKTRMPFSASGVTVMTVRATTAFSMCKVEQNISPTGRYIL